MAVAVSILTDIYYILRDRVAYNDLGPDYFNRLVNDALLRRVVRRIETSLRNRPQEGRLISGGACSF